jgi:HTH-type transcriptional regulator / antitoxin HigA
MSQLTKDERALLSKPGEVISEALDHLKMTQSELAERMGKTPSKINDIINAKEPITMATALQLEKVLGIDANFWMNREILYREKLARIEEAEQMETCIEWVKLQPYKQLIENGYLKSSKPGPEMVSEMLGFYGVASIDQWTGLYLNKFASTQFRKSSAHQTKLGAVSAWMRIGELEKQKMQLPDFDKNIFKEVLQEIKTILRKHPEDFAEQLRAKCAKAGVAIVYTPMFPNIPASGAVRWVGGNPVIQLTDRHKTNDQFWFAFFHEAGHILLHGKKEVFIENFEGYELDEEQENEANSFAANQLLPASFLETVPSAITEEVIRAIARSYQTHPAIVLGRLQKLGKLAHTFGKTLKATITLEAFTSLNKRNDM